MRAARLANPRKYHYFSGGFGNASAPIWADAIRLMRRLDVARPLLRGDFFPLTTWTVDEHSWMAWQHLRADGDEDPAGPVALIQAFRRHSPVATQQYTLRGLLPATRYSVVAWDDDARAHAVTWTGAQLASHGVAVTIAERPGAAMLLFYRLA